MDVGSKTIGIAISDPMGWIAQGLRTLRRKRTADDCRELGDIVRENAVGTVVIGLPLNMDGTEGPQAQNVKKFGEEMKKILGDVPVVYWDERLSTVAAERGLLEADLSRAKRKEVINHMAAAYILQGYLDAHREPGKGGGA